MDYQTETSKYGNHYLLINDILVGGLSQGGVAGVVIVVLLIVALIIGGVVIGVVFWVYQPWSNGWFGVEARLKNKTWRGR